MATTHFSGPVESTGGFTGDITGDVTGAVTGNVTGNLTGLAFQGASATAIAASGAIPLTRLFSLLDSSGGALAMTLADGTAGQMIIIKCETAGNNAVITPAHLADGTTLTQDAAGEISVLVFDGTNWQIVYNTATLA